MLEQTEVTALRWSKPSAARETLPQRAFLLHFTVMNVSFHTSANYSYYTVKCTFGDKTGDTR